MVPLPRVWSRALVLLLLPACGVLPGSGSSSSDADASAGGDGDPGDLGLSAAPETLSFRGTSSASLAIEADGAWEAEASEDWLSVEPTAGSGDAAITVTVDRGGLDVDDYSGSISIRGDKGSVSVWVLMRFPEVHGTVQSASTGVAQLALEGTEAGEPVAGEIIVRLDPQMVALAAYGELARDPGVGELERAVERLGAYAGASDARLLSPTLGLAELVVEAERVPAAVAALAADGRTVYAEANQTLRPSSVDDTHYSVQWHYDLIELEGAWEVSTGAAETVVAVIDADFHPEHPDLRDNLLPGWNFAEDSDDLLILNEECLAHGTHVAGTVAATTNNAEGVAGVAPEVRVLPLNVAQRPEQETECGLSSSAIARAILFAAGAEDGAAGQLDRRVDVINLSLGGDGASRAIEDALDYARDAGVVVVAAAGNTGQSVQFPASHSTAIAVSAIDQFLDVTDYSSTGPEVFVAAPGGDLNQPLEDYDGRGPRAGILSTGWAYDSLDEVMVYDTVEDDPEHGYLLHQGTSMASPHVAGVAALMRSANRDLDPNAVDQILAATAVDLGADGRDDAYGHGLVDAAFAVAAAEQYVVLPVDDLTVRLLAGDAVVAQTQTDDDGSFHLVGVPAGEYTLTAGEEGTPDAVFGSVDVSVSYDGDVEVNIPVTAN